MKHSFITTQILLVLAGHKNKIEKKVEGKPILEQLAETIAERNLILSRLHAPKDIHQQLRETIEQFKRQRKVYPAAVHILFPMRRNNNAA